MVILLNGWILPIGGVASGRVCACSLRSRLFFLVFQFFSVFLIKFFVLSYKKFDKVVELVGGGSVINGAYPV